MIHDIGIVGAGIAGCFAALRISENNPSNKIVLFELGRPNSKRRRQIEGWFGCFPTGDGKIYPGDVDNVLQVADGRRAKPAAKWVMEWMNEVNPMKLIKDNLPTSSLQKKIKEADFEIKLNNYIQWKPESIHALSKLIAETIENNTNITFSFDNEVFKIIKKRGHFLVSTAQGDYSCKKLIICVGRSGWRWVSNLYKDLGITQNDDYASFGIRVEIAAQHLKDFNKSHCSLSKGKLEVGPFSWFGTVIPEDHADLVISAFRSNEDRWKSDKVSFSLTSSEYFKNTGSFQTDRLAKLAFLLFNDRVSREKIRLFLKNESQLNLLPEYNWLHNSLKELETLIPQLLTRGYFHVPNILPMASQVSLDTTLQTEIDGMYVAGESAGIRGILAAAVMGTICADSACK